MKRSRREIEAEMEVLVADARACDLADDDLGYEIDHQRLNELLEEYRQTRLEK